MTKDIESPRPTITTKLVYTIKDAYGMQFNTTPKDLGGSRNLNLLLNTRDGKYVARVYRSWITPQRLGTIQAARKALNASGVPSPVIVATHSGEQWIREGDSLLEVEEYVEHDANMDTWERIAIGLPWLGRTHNILSKVLVDGVSKQPMVANHVGAEEVLDVTKRGTKQIRSWLLDQEQLRFADVAESLAHHLKEAERPFVGKLPNQLVHGDFWDNNVFFRDNKVVLVTDLDFMGERPRVDDLALTLYYTNSTFADDHLSDTRIKKLKRLVDAYNAGLEEPLSLIELQALPLAIARTPLFMMRYFEMMITKEEAAKQMAGTLPDLEWALKLIDNLKNWQEIFSTQ